MPGPEQLVFLIPMTALMVPIVAIVTSHMRSMARLKLELRQRADQQVLDEIRRVRDDVASLRDTTTKYDLSFDTALQRIESRVSHLESRVGVVEASQEAQPVDAAVRL
jgi:hypothetical protein